MTIARKVTCVTTKTNPMSSLSIGSWMNVPVNMTKK